MKWMKALVLLLAVFAMGIVYAQEANGTNETNSTMTNSSTNTTTEPTNETQSDPSSNTTEQDPSNQTIEDPPENNTGLGSNDTQSSNTTEPTANDTQSTNTTPPTNTAPEPENNTQIDTEENYKKDKDNDKDDEKFVDMVIDVVTGNNSNNSPTNQTVNVTVNKSENTTTNVTNISEPPLTPSPSGPVGSVVEDDEEEDTEEDLFIDESAITKVKKVPDDKPTKIPIKVDINVLLEKPEELDDAPGFVYQYLDIRLVSGSEKEYELNFKVSKQWLNKNYVTKESIAMYKFDGEWKELQTEIVSEDDQYVYYKANTPDFSYFAISGHRKVVDATIGKWALITIATVTGIFAYVYKKVNNGFL